MKILILVLVLVTFASCAHHHKNSGHHHHECKKSCKLNHKSGKMFDKKCAYSLAEGDSHINGSEDFKLKHGNETYYFSSKEKLEKFMLNLKDNLKAAKKNWVKSERK